MKPSVDRAIRQAATLAAKGQKAEAEKLYREILQRFPANQRAQQGLRALQGGNADIAAHLVRGNALHQAGRLSEALASIDAAITLKPDSVEAHNERGSILTGLGQMDEAVASFDRAISAKPALAIPHFNRATALIALKRLDEALASFEAAIRLQPDLASAHLGRGNVLYMLKRTDEAIASYDAALRYRPDFADAHSNRGFALEALGRLDEAIAAYDAAIGFKPDFAAAHLGRGNVLYMLKRPEQALASFSSALRLKPDLGAAAVQLLYQKALICDWSKPGEPLDIARMDLDAAPIAPHQFLALGDDPKLQLDIARAWTRGQSTTTRTTPRPAARSGKLRIGYFSADFYGHATMLLMARLFEVHDREKFEIHAFSYGPDNQDAMLQRLKAAFDAYHDVRDIGDADIAQLSRDRAIDVAIDLKGHTFASRSNMFAYRAAPVQMNYLGYPGTMGADYIDYIVADPVLIPEDSRRFYSEKVIYLPESYQVNDDLRPLPAAAPSRVALGLPDVGFVFCCFNNNYKYCPASFDVWMRLLKQVEGSVFWLFEGEPLVRTNLRKEAEARGVDPERLVFAAKLPYNEHLARHACADLFLDTFSCNAHTTASDALWAGLPMVSRPGRSFAARVGASLLEAVGLPELVAETTEAYEQLALDLATQPERLAAIKAKLTANRATAPLFDTERFARHIEAAYEAAFQRCLDGLPPDHIHVRPI